MHKYSDGPDKTDYIVGKWLKAWNCGQSPPKHPGSKTTMKQKKQLRKNRKGGK